MVDLEKDTRRWWFSPRSWLCRSMSAWMASSTEPIWIRAIFRSFLWDRGKGLVRQGRGGGNGRRWGGEGAPCSLEELEPFDDAAIAGEEDLEVILRDGGPVGRQPASGAGTTRAFWDPQTGLYRNCFRITSNAPLGL